VHQLHYNIIRKRNNSGYIGSVANFSAADLILNKTFEDAIVVM